MKGDGRPFKPKKFSVPFIYPGVSKWDRELLRLEGRPSVVRDVEIHNQPVLWMRRK